VSNVTTVPSTIVAIVTKEGEAIHALPFVLKQTTGLTQLVNWLDGMNILQAVVTTLTGYQYYCNFTSEDRAEFARILGEDLIAAGYAHKDSDVGWRLSVGSFLKAATPKSAVASYVSFIGSIKLST
jgi:hypothetical protein